mmetsp:Transcript_25093/g.54571  ORF Transcript_25093/g.54571 Transcript_25093/m.54571 type:complete len:240 (-) Transcript_25093:1428-2147(-)
MSIPLFRMSSISSARNGRLLAGGSGPAAAGVAGWGPGAAAPTTAAEGPGEPAARAAATSRSYLLLSSSSRPLYRAFSSALAATQAAAGSLTSPPPLPASWRIRSAVKRAWAVRGGAGPCTSFDLGAALALYSLISLSYRCRSRSASASHAARSSGLAAFHFSARTLLTSWKGISGLDAAVSLRLRSMNTFQADLGFLGMAGSFFCRFFLGSSSTPGPTTIGGMGGLAAEADSSPLPVAA